mgnify:CR=1 FL=1
MSSTGNKIAIQAFLLMIATVSLIGALNIDSVQKLAAEATEFSWRNRNQYKLDEIMDIWKSRGALKYDDPDFIDAYMTVKNGEILIGMDLIFDYKVFYISNINGSEQCPNEMKCKKIKNSWIRTEIQR